MGDQWRLEGGEGRDTKVHGLVFLKSDKCKWKRKEKRETKGRKEEKRKQRTV